MPILPDIKTPGTYVLEAAAGINNVDLASFTACYMFGYAAGGTVTDRDVAVKVNDVTDFVTKFGAASTSQKSVEAYFDNCAQGYGGSNAGVLYFINVTRAGAAPTSAEYVTSIGKVFDRYMPKGTIIAPAAFEALTVQADRTAVGNKMRDEAEKFNLLAIVDSGAATTFAAVNTEQALYTSSKGHLVFFGGHVRNLANVVVPSSPYFAGTMNRVYRQAGINQPPAGSNYVLRGVLSTVINFTDSDQEILNPAGCNVIRNIYGKGINIRGMRTKSNQVRTQFIHERVILNVLTSTLQDAFDSLLFTSLGSDGELLTRVGDSIRDVCHRLWRRGCFYGTIPNKAYGVICDMTNNLPSDLQNGIVAADVYVAITPALERLFITVRPTALDQVELAISIVSGTGNTKDEQLTQPNQQAA